MPKRVTENQLAANRANAQRSTGPRTPQGKAVARYNAITHGILAHAVLPEALLPYEAQADFDRLLHNLVDEWAPATTLEQLLVEQIAVAYWRLARLYRAEAGASARSRDAAELDLAFKASMRALDRSLGKSPVGLQRELEAEQAALMGAMDNPVALRSWMAAQDPALRTATDHAIRRAAQDRLAELETQLAQRAHHDYAVELASRNVPELDTVLKYARYEAALQRQLKRALTNLERLQRRRSGEFVAPPLTIEVDGLDVGDDTG